MAKKIILAIIAILIISAFFINFTINDSVNLYIDGENVTVRTIALNPNVNTEDLNRDICNYTLNIMNDTTRNYRIN